MTRKLQILKKTNLLPAKKNNCKIPTPTMGVLTLDSSCWLYHDPNLWFQPSNGSKCSELGYGWLETNDKSQSQRLLKCET